jgi:hypothetical protein
MVRAGPAYVPEVSCATLGQRPQHFLNPDEFGAGARPVLADGHQFNPQFPRGNPVGDRCKSPVAALYERRWNVHSLEITAVTDRRYSRRWRLQRSPLGL